MYRILWAICSLDYTRRLTNKPPASNTQTNRWIVMTNRIFCLPLQRGGLRVLGRGGDHGYSCHGESRHFLPFCFTTTCMRAGRRACMLVSLRSRLGLLQASAVQVRAHRVPVGGSAPWGDRPRGHVYPPQQARRRHHGPTRRDVPTPGERDETVQEHLQSAVPRENNIQRWDWETIYQRYTTIHCNLYNSTVAQR